MVNQTSSLLLNIPCPVVSAFRSMFAVVGRDSSPNLSPVEVGLNPRARNRHGRIEKHYYLLWDAVDRNRTGRMLPPQGESAQQDIGWVPETLASIV